MIYDRKRSNFKNNTMKTLNTFDETKILFGSTKFET